MSSEQSPADFAALDFFTDTRKKGRRSAVRSLKVDGGHGQEGDGNMVRIAACKTFPVWESKALLQGSDFSALTGLSLGSLRLLAPSERLADPFSSVLGNARQSLCGCGEIPGSCSERSYYS